MSAVSGAEFDLTDWGAIAVALVLLAGGAEWLAGAVSPLAVALFSLVGIGILGRPLLQNLR